MAISSRRVKKVYEIYTFRTSKQLPSMVLSHVNANGLQADRAGRTHDMQTLTERNAITQRVFLNQMVLVVKTRLYSNSIEIWVSITPVKKFGPSKIDDCCC